MTPAVAAPPPPPGAPAVPPTVADLVADLGGIPLERIWLHPLPGQATEQDVLYAHDHLDRLCELVDGVLVEKPMGYPESKLAVELAALLRNHIRPGKLGSLAGEAGMMRLRPRSGYRPEPHELPEREFDCSASTALVVVGGRLCQAIRRAGLRNHLGHAGAARSGRSRDAASSLSRDWIMARAC